MALYSSTLAWKILWTEEPGGLQSMGSRRVRHDWVTSLSLFTSTHWRRKWQPTPVFLPGESQGWQNLVGCCLWDHTESDTTEATAAAAEQMVWVGLMVWVEAYMPCKASGLLILFQTRGILFSDLPNGKLNLATLWKIDWIVEILKTESAVKLRSKYFLNLRTNMGDKLTSGDLLRIWGYSATCNWFVTLGNGLVSFPLYLTDTSYLIGGTWTYITFHEEFPEGNGYGSVPWIK